MFFFSFRRVTSLEVVNVGIFSISNSLPNLEISNPTDLTLQIPPKYPKRTTDRNEYREHSRKGKKNKETEELERREKLYTQ